MNHSDRQVPGLRISRRGVIGLLGGGAGAVALGAVGGLVGADTAHADTAPAGRGSDRVRRYDAQTSWQPMPENAAATKDVQILPDVRLRVWDTGGRGPVIVWLHPYSGSGEGFGYQHEALARAGYRSISYSRRGFLGSDAGPADDTGTVAGDLHLLMDALRIDRFHLVGTAAGGFGVFDYAISHPERLRSATLSNTLAGISEPEWSATTTALLPPQWATLPKPFQELGPSYRAAYPEGVARWEALESRSKPAPVAQGALTTVDWAAVESIRTPMLILSSDADLYMPPARMRMILDHVPNGEGAIVSEAGHVPFYEHPQGFNEAIMSFTRRR